MNRIDLDETARAILDLLGEDARLSNRAIARRLELAEGTVRTRIKRLTDRRLLRFTAITDHRQHGNPEFAFLRIRADMRQAEAITEALRRYPQLRTVIMMLGNFNILAVGLFDSREEIGAITSDLLGGIPGVLDVQASIVTQSIKYNERIAKL